MQLLLGVSIELEKRMREDGKHTEWFNNNEHEPMLLSVGVQEELPMTCSIGHVELDRGWRAHTGLRVWPCLRRIIHTKNSLKTQSLIAKGRVNCSDRAFCLAVLVE
mgnify:CR=1 FL=1